LLLHSTVFSVRRWFPCACLFHPDLLLGRPPAPYLPGCHLELAEWPSTEDLNHNLEQQKKFPPSHTHVFTGDFNANVAEEQEEASLTLPAGTVPPRKGDTIRDDTFRLRHPPAPDNMRTVTDHASSAQRGRLLLRMLNNIGYIILNGRFEPNSHPNSPPLPPPYTLQRDQGRIAAIIDYCLVSIDQFQRVKSYNVISRHAHNLTTDHNPIHLHFLIPRVLESDNIILETSNDPRTI
jgi:hypothetical protein